MIEFFVPGDPQGKGRARSFIKKGAKGKPVIGHHTPEKTRSYESLIAGLGLDARNRPASARPFALRVTIYKSVPASWPKWKRDMALLGEIRPTTKPDGDNVLKAVKDGLNGVFWLDDCQVVEDHVVAYYAEARPGLAIQVREINAHPASITARPQLAPAAP